MSLGLCYKFDGSTRQEATVGTRWKMVQQCLGMSQLATSCRAITLDWTGPLLRLWMINRLQSIIPAGSKQWIFRKYREDCAFAILN